MGVDTEDLFEKVSSGDGKFLDPFEIPTLHDSQHVTVLYDYGSHLGWSGKCTALHIYQLNCHCEACVKK